MNTNEHTCHTHATRPGKKKPGDQQGRGRKTECDVSFSRPEPISDEFALVEVLLFCWFFSAALECTKS